MQKATGKKALENLLRNRKMQKATGKKVPKYLLENQKNKYQQVNIMQKMY
jgi:hypothetical protein